MSNGVTNLKSGDILFVQGDVPRELYLLQSGKLEILAASSEFNGLDRGIIISKSRRVGTIDSKVLISGLSSQLTQPYRMSVRAVSDSSLAKYPLKNGGIKGIASGDPSQAITILRHLFTSLNAANGSISKYTRLYQTLSMISDNLALIYKELSETNAPDYLHDNAQALAGTFISSGGSLPKQVDARFLITDNSKFLNKRYRLPDSIHLLSSRKVDDVLIRILRLDQSIILNMFRSDPEIVVSMYEAISDNYIHTMNNVARISGLVDEALAQIFGNENSWTAYLIDMGGFDEWSNSGSFSPDFIKNFLSLLVKVNGLYEELSGRKMTAVFPGIRKIHEYYSSGKEAPAAVAPAAPVDTGKGAAPAVISSGEMSKSIHQIFEFSLVQKDFKKKFLKLINDFKGMKNPFNTDSDGRKIRRQITKFYWDLYKQAYVRSKTESSVPRPVHLMLNFGYLDETLLDPGQVNELNDLSRLREKSREIPVLMETEFLDFVQQGKVEPSITEMGLTYEGFLKEQEKHKSRKKKKEEPKADVNLEKVLFEIDQRTAITSAICSGSTQTAFPILTQYMARGSLKSIYTYKRKIEMITKEVKNIDFSVFFRETVLKLGDAREIIMEEVVPYFVLLPIFGSRTQLWQVLTGTNKRSRGRIVLPILFIGDLRKSLVHTFASFRWELNRDVKGPQWADPIDGGITGEYFDYVNTFKKMSKLSQETKEKIAEKFKGLRTNRDRFADDYIQWILYEKDGIMKQNNVVRDMFFRHIPFTKDIRAKLEAMPAFTQIATRYKNVHKREVDAYERRFKKYMDETGKYPIEIQKFFEYLNR